MRKHIKIAAAMLMANTVAGCGGEVLVAAIASSATNRPTFCEKPSGEVYSLRGDCAGNEREITFDDYRRLYRERAANETNKVIAANEAARNAKTYCLTALSNTPYIAASGQCQQSDRPISEEDYLNRKSDQSSNLSTPPSQPIAAHAAPPNAPATQSAAAEPTPPPSLTKGKPQPEIEPPSMRTDLASIPDDAKAVSSGTAFFVAKEGRLLTNHHVIEDCDWIGLMADGGLHTAVTVADSPKLDLAMLKTDFEGPAIAVFADQQPEIGEDSYVAGYPLLDTLWSLNFTNGIISSQSPLGEPRLLQTTAPVQHGNSGGPMFDASGHVVGVVVARYADRTAENVNFAIKSNVATNFMDQSGIMPKVAARGSDLKASAIAKRARSIVVPAICFKRS